MHSLARFASNVELLLPVCPLQHQIRAAKSSEALPVVPEWSKGGQLRRDSKNWGHTGEWASVLIYWSNFTGAPVVLLETSSTVCRCSAGHTGGRERVSVCAHEFSGAHPKPKRSFFFFGMSSRSKKKKKKPCLKQQNHWFRCCCFLSPPQQSHKAASASNPGHMASWTLNYC